MRCTKQTLRTMVADVVPSHTSHAPVVEPTPFRQPTVHLRRTQQAHRYPPLNTAARMAVPALGGGLGEHVHDHTPTRSSSRPRRCCPGARRPSSRLPSRAGPTSAQMSPRESVPKPSTRLEWRGQAPVAGHSYAIQAPGLVLPYTLQDALLHSYFSGVKWTGWKCC